MYCSHCGEAVVGTGRFCSHCGKPLVAQPAVTSLAPSQWEYTYYRVSWDSGKGGRYPLTFGKTEYSVRLDNWGRDQHWILPEIQSYIDKGWEPIHEIGPGSYHFVRSKDYTGGITYYCLEVVQFLVKFRRPATPLTDLQKELLGKWEEVEDPNKGFGNNLMNKLNSRSSAQRAFFTFFRDKTFVWINRYERKYNGIYYLT